MESGKSCRAQRADGDVRRHAARPPMAEGRTPGHRLKMEMFDGERCLPAGAEVPESDFDATLLDRGILTLMEAEPIAPGR